LRGRGIFGGYQHHFIGDDFVEIAQPFEDRCALLCGQGCRRFELGSHAARTVQSRTHGRLQTGGAFSGGEVKLIAFVFCAEECDVIEFRADGGCACCVDVVERCEQPFTGVAQQADQGFLGGVGAQHIGVADLGVLAFFGKVRINLLEDFIEDRAMLFEADPDFKTFEGAMVGSLRENGIADEPFDDEIKANVPFEVAQRPVVEILDEQGAHETWHGMRRGCSWSVAMMIIGADGFEWGKIQLVGELDKEMVAVAFEQGEVDWVAQPDEQLSEVGLDDSQRKIGYNRHGGLRWCEWDVTILFSHTLRPLST
jgi:hypothetical protein